MSNVATKKKRKEAEKVKLSASHVMLYIVLCVYILVALSGIAFIGLCIADKSYDSAASGLITVGSIIGACSCTVVGFYSTKASKENEIKLSNDKYRMRLEIAKDIFKEYGNTLDDKSIDLLRKLMSDDNITEIPTSIPKTEYSWQMPQIDIPINNNGNDSEEGMG